MLTTTRRKRKLTDSDRGILAEVIRDHGRKRVYQIYSAWFNRKDIEFRKGEGVGLLRFLRDIAFDYTYTAIFDTVDEIARERRASLRRKGPAVESSSGGMTRNER